MSKSKPSAESSFSLEGSRLYKWRCPVCGVSNIGTTEQRNGPVASGLHALQSHIRAKADEGHGPQYTLPEELTEEKLRRCVEADES